MTNVSLMQSGLPNCTVVTVGDTQFLFSYNTCVAFHDGDGWVVCENVWSNTTGKHLNWTGVDRKDRIPREEFMTRLDQVLRGRKVQ
jgi:hypothetical protein